MKNMTPRPPFTSTYVQIRSPPRIKALAAGWQVWDFAQEGSGDTIHIDYDGDYGSERVLIVCGGGCDGMSWYAADAGQACCCERCCSGANVLCYVML